MDTYYANNRGAEKYRACAAYADFRELLEQEKDLDAVKIMTPDHLHATIAIAAMKKGKHVLVHKPIANRLHEGRLVFDTVRQTQMATHLLAYGSGAGNELIARRIKEGVDRQAPGNPQLDEPAGVAAVHGTPHRHAADPQGIRLGLVAWSGRGSTLSPALHAHGLPWLV